MKNEIIALDSSPDLLRCEVEALLKEHPDAKVITVQKWYAGVADTYACKFMVMVESGNLFSVLKLYQFHDGSFGSVETNTMNAGEIIELVSYSELLQQFLKLRKG